jgi:PAS domain S-box-containing protein
MTRTVVIRTFALDWYLDGAITTEDLVMVGSYDNLLVVLSVLISIMGAYAARELPRRVSDARGWAWLTWVVGGATADGIGTWSMHYTGMLAFSLPVPVVYDWPTVLLSLVIGIIGSVATLVVLSRSQIGWSRVAAGILLGGVGISGLHFTAMAAMRFQGMHHYSPALATLSVVLGIVISSMALMPTLLFPDDTPARRLRTHGSVVLRGLANPVMHYTAMAAATFTYSDEIPDLSHAVRISSLGILGIIIVPVMVLAVSLLTSLVDRLQKQKALLDELFEQAPHAVALMGADDRVVRVNGEFTRLFRYTSQEAFGRRLGELIVPDVPRDEDQRSATKMANGERVDVEVVRRRKDGSRLQVAMVRVPVSVPGGQIEIYEIYRDITERKRADEALRQYAERLQVLSRRVVEVQEEERRHLARELHDEIGQVLSAIAVNLHAAKGVCNADAWSRLDECLDIVDVAVQQVRGLALELRPSMLDDLGLAAALRWLVSRQAERAGLVAHFVVQSSGVELPTELATACYRVAQEALTNVVRHARARRVWLELQEGEEEVRLVIRDDGVGFDPKEARQRAARGESLGLLGIQERVELLGGRVTIESEPGHGTTIRVWFPVEPTLPTEQPGQGASDDEDDPDPAGRRP